MDRNRQQFWPEWKKTKIIRNNRNYYKMLVSKLSILKVASKNHKLTWYRHTWTTYDINNPRGWLKIIKLPKYWTLKGLRNKCMRGEVRRTRIISVSQLRSKSETRQPWIKLAAMRPWWRMARRVWDFLGQAWVTADCRIQACSPIT